MSVILAACVSLALTLRSSPSPDVGLLFALGLLALLVEWFAIEIPSGGSASLAISIYYAAVLLGGPLTAAITSLFTAVTRQDLRVRKPLIQIAFNASQLLLATLGSGWLFLAMGGRPLLQTGVGHPSIAAWLLPALAIIPAQAGINIALVAVAIALMREMSLRETWAVGIRPYLGGLAAPFLLGLVFAQLVAIGGYWSIVLLVAPFLVAKQTFRVYQDQADAYRDTLRSLVSALEAKDTYTRGHSERVARYARGTAEELGLSETQVKEIEQAALLHDIGKIAISTSILRKPAALSASEYELIQGHPALAADTLADIEFLEGIVPMISGHHERLDGKGYPHGLRGADITLGARILAVADCFDAMTSDRPYRQALQSHEAVSSLLTAAGTQLDHDCVAAFLKWAEGARLVGSRAVAAEQ